MVWRIKPPSDTLTSILLYSTCSSLNRSAAIPLSPYSVGQLAISYYSSLALSLSPPVMSPQLRPVISYPCQVCGTPTSNWCSRCISVWYCSEDHLNQVCTPCTSLSKGLPTRIDASTTLTHPSPLRIGLSIVPIAPKRVHPLRPPPRLSRLPPPPRPPSSPPSSSPQTRTALGSFVSLASLRLSPSRKSLSPPKPAHPSGHPTSNPGSTPLPSSSLRISIAGPSDSQCTFSTFPTPYLRHQWSLACKKL